LVVLNGWRLIRYFHAVYEDFSNPHVSFGFFTFVAATNVIGMRLSLDGYYQWTGWLLLVASIGWLLLGYLVPWTTVLGSGARPAMASADGTWFVWVVASQSVAIAAATLEPITSTARSGLAIFAVLAWSLGCFLYAAEGVFVLLREMMYDFKAEDLTPSYWVAMGAASITVLAGARIVQMATAPMVEVMHGLIAGLSVMFWALAAWLIPLLTAAMWWRHGTHRVPIRYESDLWSVIFPLGMFAVASIYLGDADNLPLIGDIGEVELWVAFGAWVLTFVAMLAHLARGIFAAPKLEPGRS
ncbi:MAG: tellurite resistance/C4-dicarboxylate transporter family protein, partial [Nocardioidaceae bacterium]